MTYTLLARLNGLLWLVKQNLLPVQINSWLHFAIVHNNRPECFLQMVISADKIGKSTRMPVSNRITLPLMPISQMKTHSTATALHLSTNSPIPIKSLQSFFTRLRGILIQFFQTKQLTSWSRIHHPCSVLHFTGLWVVGEQKLHEDKKNPISATRAWSGIHTEAKDYTFSNE